MKKISKVCTRNRMFARPLAGAVTVPRSRVQYPTMAKKNSVRSAGKRWLGAKRTAVLRGPRGTRGDDLQC